ncbi:PREDICTED: uncharacterized protein K02A2.6-like [Priapulus caudatus]|uniref:Uncharacterized protein K02A2.6-like n=1 Tax=Priapulus caudatus TaxID=37621 RepID=A0ABM1ETE8_PRICU|nr:PREDICTED: uncharacterized protein K02A2.6-like [Priapulus caudatus]
MAKIAIELVGLSAFDCGGQQTTVGPRWTVEAKGVVNEAQEKALLLHSVGSDVQELYETLTDPGPGVGVVEDTASSTQKVIRTLDAHFIVKRNETYERHVFRAMAQSKSETVDQLVARLRKQGAYCGFANVEQDIRDQIIDKCQSTKLRRKLLEKSELTLSKAMDIARALESVENQMKVMDLASGLETSTSGEVNVVKRREWKQPSNKSGKACYRCGNVGHYARDECCPAKKATCDKCGKVGHYAKVCHTKLPGTSAGGDRQGRSGEGQRFKWKSRVKNMNLVEPDSNDEDSDGVMGMYSIQEGKRPPVKVHMKIENVGQELQVDTGASVSVMPARMYREEYAQIPLQKCNVKLTAYGGRALKVLGQMMVKVEYQKTECTLPLVVVDSEGPLLLGRNWLAHIKLNWAQIFMVQGTCESKSVEEVVKQHAKLFESELGTVKGFKADIKLREGAQPIFHRARPVPYALRDKVEAELDRLEAEGVIKKVKSSDWASPIVCVPKKDGAIRICGDFKVSVNQVLIDNPYPLPDMEDMFATMGQGTVFSKIDLSNAYQQMTLTEESQQYLTINTHKGLCNAGFNVTVLS